MLVAVELSPNPQTSIPMPNKRQAFTRDEAGDEDADRVRSERASHVASVRRLLEAVATAEAASKAAR